MKNISFKLVLWIFSIVVLSPSAALASTCSQYQSQLEKNECISLEWQKEDGHLNDIYNKYKNMLTETEKQDLKATQLAWIKYKEGDCQLYGMRYSAGSMYRYIVTQCELAKTKLRIKELQDLIALWEEMDK